MQSSILPILKISLLYCILAVTFAPFGVFIPEKIMLVSPVDALSINEIGGHFLFGVLVASVTLSLRYILLSGLFAVLIDSDHWVGLFHFNGVARMAHSLLFGVISALILMAIFGKKDYKLGIIVFGSLLSHISYDIFVGEHSHFPLFIPFYNHMIGFVKPEWIYFEITAVVVIGIVTLLTSNTLKKQNL